MLQYTYCPILHEVKATSQWGRKTSSRPIFVFFEEKALYQVKTSGLQLSFNIFLQASTWHTTKTNLIKLQTTDPGICLILVFQKRVWKQFLHHILCMFLQEKYFSCYILLIDQISLLGCLYFFIHWVICVLSLLVSQFVMT